MVDASFGARHTATCGATTSRWQTSLTFTARIIASIVFACTTTFEANLQICVARSTFDGWLRCKQCVNASGRRCGTADGASTQSLQETRMATAEHAWFGDRATLAQLQSGCTAGV